MMNFEERVLLFLIVTALVFFKWKYPKKLEEEIDEVSIPDNDEISILDNFDGAILLSYGPLSEEAIEVSICDFVPHKVNILEQFYAEVIYEKVGV